MARTDFSCPEHGEGTNVVECKVVVEIDLVLEECEQGTVVNISVRARVHPAPPARLLATPDLPTDRQHQTPAMHI